MWQYSELEARVLREKCNIVGVLKTWVNQDIDWEIKLQRYQICRRDEGNKTEIVGKMGKRNITSEKIFLK